MDKDTRRIVKRCVFLTIYGGGAKAMHSNVGVDMGTAQSIIDSFYGRYPRVKTWQDSMIANARSHGFFPTDPKVICGQPAKIWQFSEPTGRKHTWHQKEAPSWVKEVLSFSPTELKNYRVQALATADIAPLFVALVFLMFQELRAKGTGDHWALHMVVHDSLLIEVSPPKNTGPQVNRLFAALSALASVGVARAFKNLWGYEFPLTLRLDGESKQAWHEASPHKLN
jgi:hypothetical protein